MKNTFAEIYKIIRRTDKEINKIYNNSSVEEPVQNDLILSMRNMAYNDIRKIVKTKKREMENDENE